MTPKWHDYVLGSDSGIFAARASDGVDLPVRLGEAGEVVILDAGVVVSGHVVLDSAPGDEAQVKLSYSETREFLGPDGDFKGFGGPDTLTLAEARTRCGRLAGGFRYVRVELLEGGPVTLVAAHVESASVPSGPASLRGHFVCSDEELTRLWYAGVYTVQLNTNRPGVPIELHGSGEVLTKESWILDGPKRDRVYWTGDLAVAAPVNYISYAFPEAVRNCLVAAAENQAPDGYVQVFGSNHRIPMRYQSYVAHWVIQLETYERYTGDTGLVSLLWPTLEDAMAYVERSTDEADGLVVSDPFEAMTWHSAAIPGKEIANNCLWYGALRAAATLATARERAEVAARWTSLADRVADSINGLLWSEERGAYVVSEMFPDTVPQDGNAMAVLFGIAPDDRAERALAYLQQRMWGPFGTAITDNADVALYGGPYISPFITYFELAARMKVGDEAGALDLARRTFGHMLANDPHSTMWERMSLKGTTQGAFFGPAGESKSHAWSSGMALLGTEWIVGLQPTSPGYATWKLEPHPSGLSFAEATVPSKSGPISVRWERDGDGLAVWVDSPADSSGELHLPDGTSRRIEGGRQELRVPWPAETRALPEIETLPPARAREMSPGARQFAGAVRTFLTTIMRDRPEGDVRDHPAGQALQEAWDAYVGDRRTLDGQVSTVVNF